MRTDKKMKNSLDFYKIEINGKLLGVLNFNLMIPIEEEQLQLIDLTVHKRDREKLNEIFAGKERCLNFSKLEAECEKFNSKIKKKQ